MVHQYYTLNCHSHRMTRWLLIVVVYPCATVWLTTLFCSILCQCAVYLKPRKWGCWPCPTAKWARLARVCTAVSTRLIISFYIILDHRISSYIILYPTKNAELDSCWLHLAIDPLAANLLKRHRCHFWCRFSQQGEGHQKSTPLCLIFRGSTVNNRQEAS